MKMKRLLGLILAIALLSLPLAACGSSGRNLPADEPAPPSESLEVSDSPQPEAPEDTAEPEPEPEPERYEAVGIRIGALKGPTGAGLALLMDRNEKGEAANNYSFTLSAAPDEVLGKVITGEYDIAAVPTNLAATLYNKTEGQVQMLAINTLGVLYILQDTSKGGAEISSVEELRGKTIYVSGQAANPEYALNYILRSKGLEPGVDLNIEFLATHDELVALAASGETEFCMLPEPNVSVVSTKNEDIKAVIDMSEQWDIASGGGSRLTMGCLVVQKDFAQAHPEAVEKFLEEYGESVDLINSDLDAAAALVEQFEIVPSAAIAKKALPNCNIVFIKGSELEPAVQGYFEMLFEADAKSVGGALPGEEIYYLG